MIDQNKIGKFIKSLREKEKMTQKELANKLNVTDKAVSKWERGDGLPDPSNYESLAATLKITIDELLKGEKNKKEEKVKNQNFTKLELAVKSGFESIIKFSQTQHNIIYMLDDKNNNLFDYLIKYKNYELIKFFIDFLSHSYDNTSTIFTVIERAKYNSFYSHTFAKEQIRIGEKIMKYFNHKLLLEIYNEEKMFSLLLKNKQLELSKDALIKNKTLDHSIKILEGGYSYEEACFKEDKGYEVYYNALLISDKEYHQNSFKDIVQKNNKYIFDTYLEVAFIRKDDDLVCNFLDYEIEKYVNQPNIKTDNCYPSSFDINQYLDYFYSNNKFNLLLKYLGYDFRCKNFQNLTNGPSDIKNAILCKFEENQVPETELNWYRLAAIKIIKETPNYKECFWDYIIKYEDEEMFDTVTKERYYRELFNVMEKNLNINDNIVSYNQLRKTMEELTLKAVKYDSGEITEIEEIKKLLLTWAENSERAFSWKNPFAKQFAEKIINADTDSVYRILMESNFFEENTLFNKYATSIVRIKKFSLFKKLVLLCGCFPLRVYLKKHDVSFGNYEKIVWIVNNITNKISNEDLVLLMKKNNLV